MIGIDNSSRIDCNLGKPAGLRLKYDQLVTLGHIMNQVRNTFGLWKLHLVRNVFDGSTVCRRSDGLLDIRKLRRRMNKLGDTYTRFVHRTATELLADALPHVLRADGGGLPSTSPASSLTSATPRPRKRSRAAGADAEVPLPPGYQRMAREAIAHMGTIKRMRLTQFSSGGALFNLREIPPEYHTAMHVDQVAEEERKRQKKGPGSAQTKYLKCLVCKARASTRWVCRLCRQPLCHHPTWYESDRNKCWRYWHEHDSLGAPLHPVLAKQP